MYLIQFLLPLHDAARHPFPREMHDRVRREMIEFFGGVTAFLRGPAEGFWEQDGAVNRDDVVIFEVMTDRLDRSWWEKYKKELEKLFNQEEIVVRATVFEKL